MTRHERTSARRRPVRTGSNLAPVLTLLACLAVPLPSPPTSASTTTEPARCLPPPELVAELVDWIARHTPYDVAMTREHPPTINLCESGSVIAYEGEDVVIEESLRAAYDLRSRTVHLILPWDPSDEFDRSVLLHELVHDVQYANRHWYCRQEPEWEAYELQERWLAERGIESGFDWLHVYFLSKCPRDIHP